MTTVDDGADDGADEGAAGAARRLDALPASPGEARALARTFLADCEPPFAERTVIDTLLIVSELVTNALRHAGGVTGFQVSAGAGAIEIAVRDAGPVPAVRQEPRSDWLPGGYGWPLVHRLAEVTVVPLEEGGKYILARLRPGPDTG